MQFYALGMVLGLVVVMLVCRCGSAADGVASMLVPAVDRSSCCSRWPRPCWSLALPGDGQRARAVALVVQPGRPGGQRRAGRRRSIRRTARPCSWTSGRTGNGCRACNIRFHLGLDGISLWLFVLTALLSVTAVLVSWEAIREQHRAYYALLLLLETGMLGVFAAQDIMLFYIFFEFTLIPLFFLIGIWGGPERRLAARKFFIFTLAGSVLTFLGLIYIVSAAYAQSSARGPAELTFDIAAADAGRAATACCGSRRDEQWWLFLALLAGFAIKVPLFPFHTWLPLAHVEAPTAGSVILAGVLLKIGTYGFLRFSLPLLPDGLARVPGPASASWP